MNTPDTLLNPRARSCGLDCLCLFSLGPTGSLMRNGWDEGPWGTLLCFDLKSALQSTAIQSIYMLWWLIICSICILAGYSIRAKCLFISIRQSSGRHWVLTWSLIVNHKIKVPLSSQRLTQIPNFRRSIGLHSKCRTGGCCCWASSHCLLHWFKIKCKGRESRARWSSALLKPMICINIDAHFCF